MRIATSYTTSLQPYKNRSRYPIPLRPRPISFHFEGPKGGCNATVPGSCRFTPGSGCNECATQDHNYSVTSPSAKHLTLSTKPQKLQALQILEAKPSRLLASCSQRPRQSPLNERGKRDTWVGKRAPRRDVSSHPAADDINPALPVSRNIERNSLVWGP